MMVKFKNYTIFLLFLLGCLFVCDIPRINAQYPYWQIPSIQNTFPYTFPLRQSNMYDPFYINSWTQHNIYTYNSNPLWGGFIQGELNTQTLSGAYGFLQKNQNIWPQNPFSNLSYKQYYEYPTFYTQANQMANFPVNSYWSHYGFLLPKRSPVDHLSRGYAYFQKEQYQSAIEELKKAVKQPYEKLAKIQGYFLLGMSYQALGVDYLEEAESYLELAAGLEIYNTKVSLQLARVYYQQGKYSKAIEEYSRVIEREPENGEAIRGLALSYFKANDLTKALKQLEKAEMKDPNDLEIIYTMGIIYEEKHLYIEAIRYLNKVIDLAPGSSWASQATDHLHDIELVGGSSGIEDIEEEVKILIMTAPEPEDRPDDALIILLDDIHYQLLPDDTLIYKNHKLIKILNERGKTAGEIKLSYDTSYQHITIDLARVIKPDGTITGVSGEDIQEKTPWAGFPLYTSTKVLIISMPEVTVGSVLEYQATIEDIPDSRIFDPREIDAGFTLASTNPVKRARIKVSVPADREFNTIIKNREHLEPEIVLNGEMKDYIWRLNDIPKIIVEPMMPPLLDISPILYITSFSSWEIVDDWWRELVFQAMDPDDAIRSKVEQLTEGLYTPKDKARALFHYVASQIRYVGIEYGKSYLEPHNASVTYANKYGDCKNKAVLLITMLREAGIHEAYTVDISTVNSGRAWEDIPRIRAFDHVIALCIIDGEWIWMDPTVETSAFGEFPSVDQDREVLVTFDDGYIFMRTPVFASEKNTDREIMDVRAALDSNAAFSSTITATGINAIYSRGYFKGLDPRYRKQHLETIITGRTTGGKLIDFTLSNVEDLNEPYKLEFQYTDPYYIEWAGDIGFIKASYLSPNKAAISEEERIYPVFLGNTSVGEGIIDITLPENLKVRYLPPPITLEIPQILFISDYTLQGRTITYYLRYEIRQLYVPLEEYPEYKKFQEDVDKELKRKIIVEMD